MTSMPWSTRWQCLHEDEQGEAPVGPILLIGLIVIPLVLILVSFRNTLSGWIHEQWVRITNADTTTDPFGGN